MHSNTAALRGVGAFDVKLAIEHRLASPFVRFAYIPVSRRSLSQGFGRCQGFNVVLMFVHLPERNEHCE